MNRRLASQLDPGFEAFVHDRSKVLLRMAFLLVGDRGHAEDLLQTALLRTALRWRSAREHPEAFARQVLVNLARDRWRRSRRRVTEQSADAMPSVPSPHRDHSDAVVDRDMILRVVTLLPPRQREVVVLRFFADLSVADTAAAMRTSEGTVKSYTSRALDHLRRALGDHTAVGYAEVNYV